MKLFATKIAQKKPWDLHWKAFSYDVGHYLLHIPTSHLLEIDEEFAKKVRGEIKAGSVENDLIAIEEELPKPRKRKLWKPDISAIALNVAQLCNLRCTYCYAEHGNYGNDSTMSEETARKAVDFFSRDHSSLEISFFGGEPLMNFDLIQQVVEQCKNIEGTDFFYKITTNTTLINDNILDFLIANNFHIIASYDGKGLHAKHRLTKDGKSNSEALVQKKLELIKQKIQDPKKFEIRATITRENVDLFEDAVIDILTKQNCKFMFVLQAEKPGPKSFKVNDIEKLGKILERIVNRFLESKDYKKLLRLGNIRGHISRIHKGWACLPYCGAGVDYLSVSTSGKFYICHRFTEDESAEVGSLETGLDLKRINKFTKQRLLGFEPCCRCWMRELCGGGCYHYHIQANESAYKPDALTCLFRNTEIELATRGFNRVGLFCGFLRFAPFKFANC